MPDLPPTVEMLKLELTKLQNELAELKGKSDPELSTVLRDIRDTLSELKRMRVEKTNGRRDEPESAEDDDRKITLW